MKIFDHTIYAPNRTPKFEKTSALSVPSVVDTYQYSYVANSNLIGSVTFPNGLVTTKTYETNRNLIDKVENNFNGTARSVYDFSNDAIGRRSDVAKSGTAFTAADTITYAYNDRSEVVGADSVNDTKYNFGYNFDNLGNRKSYTTNESGSAVATNYTANALNQYATISSQTSNPEYDDDGNMTGTWLTQPDGNKADSDLYYNAENRLVKVIGNGQKLEFTYDYMGRRVNKKVYSGSETAWTLDKEVTFTYDGWNLIQEVKASVYDSNNSAFTQFRTSNYTWGLDLSQTIQGAGGVSGLLSLDKGTATYYYTYDANGNVSELIDTAGVVKAHYEYSPFGKLTYEMPDSVENPFKFSTKYLDNETQLYYYGYRYYNPENGRWINRDKPWMWENGGENLYGFIDNNPTNVYDYLGLKSPGGEEITIEDCKVTLSRTISVKFMGEWDQPKKDLYLIDAKKGIENAWKGWKVQGKKSYYDPNGFTLVDGKYCPGATVLCACPDGVKILVNVTMIDRDGPLGDVHLRAVNWRAHLGKGQSASNRNTGRTYEKSPYPAQKARRTPTRPPIMQVGVAHEFGHVIGLEHPNKGEDNEYLDPTTGEKSTALMGYGGELQEEYFKKWVDAVTKDAKGNSAEDSKCGPFKAVKE